MKYDFKKIEKKWQKIWEAKKLYTSKDGSKKKKYYALVEFPYPSGEGLHVGHVRSYTAMDVIARKRRMEGYNVLYPIGWDAFGLPTENYAIKTGIAPDIATKKNTNNFRRQLKSLGFSFNWSREINTTDPNYYRWTQWMFLQFFKHGLAYKANVPISWCPNCKIGLANEEVVQKRQATREKGQGMVAVCERCGTPVEQRQKDQWMLKITAYADKLLEGLKNLDFLPEIKRQQENWIGKSEGAEIEFPLAGKNNYVFLHGFTGRSDKNFFPWLKQKLEKRGHNVLVPQLPNTDNPTENEQVAYVLEHAKFDENTILFGHSLGSVVALKVVEKLEKPIAGLVIAGSFMDIKRRELLRQQLRPYDDTFIWSFNIERIKENCGFIKILAAENDSSIPLETSRRVHENLGGDYREVTAQGDHFTASQEPLILEALIPSIKAFTTRPDTIFGATYLALSPEHSLIKNLESRIKNLAEVKNYIKTIQRQSLPAGRQARASQRESAPVEKTGVELKGIKAINPANNEEIPILVADYVLGDVGTGAIMAVPAHDERDYEFAKKNKLPIRRVIVPPPLATNTFDTSAGGLIPSPAGEMRVVLGVECYTGVGTLVNSGKFSGMDSEKARWEITKAVQGKKEVKYKLRDWVFSRQRYWGEPIPLVFCAQCKTRVARINADQNADQRGSKNISENLRSNLRESALSEGERLNPGWVAVPEKDLPVKLPKVKDYQPRDDGQSPLASVEKWVKVKCPKCKRPARRETDVMPNWAGSSWYFLRYIDPKNYKQFAICSKLKYWLPVDWYNGGMEHVTLHLLYSRFWNRFLYDIGVVPVAEPYKKRTAHGLILGKGGVKMSKSKGNVVNPDDLVKEFGADAIRLYEMFIGPFEQAVAWDPHGILGVSRFLERAWNLLGSHMERKKHPESFSSETYRVPDEFKRAIHRTVKKVTEDIETMNYNTAISALMILLNVAEKQAQVIDLPRYFFETFFKLLAPLAPHVSEELWHRYLAYAGVKKINSIHFEPWPTYDEKIIEEETFELLIQVNGKLRDKVVIRKALKEEEVKKITLQREKVRKIIDVKKPARIIFVPGKLINLVI